MLTRFTSKGIIGVPDADLIFNDEKIILIQGPNGAGKTSLLRYITTPYRTHNNKSTELKDGVNEGLLEYDYIFNGHEYKIIHTIVRKVSKSGEVSYVNKSYFRKKVNGVFEDLVKDGNATNFAQVVEKEFAFSKSHYSVLNIGVNNFGLVNLKPAERLAHIKNIYNISYIDEMANNAANNKRTLKTVRDVLEKELESTSYDVLKSEHSEKTKEAHTLKVELVKLTHELNESYNHVNQSNLTIYDNNILEINKLISSSESIIRLLNNINETRCFSMIKDENEYNAGSLSGQLQSLNEQEIELATKISELNKLDINELNDKYNTYNESMNNNLYDDELYNKYKDYNSEDMLKYIQNIRSLKSNYNPDEVFLRIGINDFEEFKELGKTRKNNIESLNNNIAKIKIDIDKATYQENIVRLTPHKNTPLDCPLRMEWDRQVKNHDLHFKLMDELNTLEKQLEEDLVIFEDLKSVGSFINMINRIPSVEYPEINKAYIYDDHEYNVTVALLENIIANNNRKVQYDNFKELRDTIASRRDEVLKDNDNQKLTLKSNLDKITEKKIIIQNQLNEVNNLRSKFRAIVSMDDLDMLSLSELETRLIKYKGDLAKNNSERDFLENKLKEKTLKINKKEEIMSKAGTINGEVSVLAHKIKEYERRRDEWVKADKEYTIADNLYKLLSKDISVSMLVDKLQQVENVANSLLNGFMNVKFALDDGVLNILCERDDGAIRSSTVLSSGESSMLSIALMIAMKDEIAWDLISIDEGSAMLDETNTDRFAQMITEHTKDIDSISQVFLVSHDNIITEGMDIRRIVIKNGRCS